MERLGGPEPHGRRSGVVHITTEDDDDALRARPAGRLAARPPGPASPADGVTDDRPRRAAAGRDQPRLRRQAARQRPARRARRRAARQVGAEHRHRRSAGFGGRTVGVIANNPLRLGGCLDSTQRREGGPVRADVRRARRAADRGRRRARLPARRRPGVGRRGAPRREAAARVRRGGGPAGDAGDPQGLRRRVHRDELARAGRDRRVRLAGRRDRGHGRERGGQHPAPQEARRGAATSEREALRAAAGRGAEKVAGGVNRALEIGVVDEVIEPDGDPAPDRRGAGRARPAARGAHGNIPL